MSEATKSKQIELASRPSGVPTSSNFQLGTAQLSAIKQGEFLVKNQWMSVDPYMRGRMKEGESYVPPFQVGEALEGGCIGEVVESRHNKFKAGR
jgi:NADPH-dependent curcumin reductase CurA